MKCSRCSGSELIGLFRIISTEAFECHSPPTAQLKLLPSTPIYKSTEEDSDEVLALAFPNGVEVFKSPSNVLRDFSKGKKADNSHHPGSSLFRLFLTAKEGRETSVCEVQVKGKADSNPAITCMWM